MKKNAGKNQNNDSSLEREDKVRRSLEHGEGGADRDEGGTQHQDVEKFDPRHGEDPGALELTEDPLERRQKRVTM
jgi:hypothetical protein